MQMGMYVGDKDGHSTRWEVMMEMIETEMERRCREWQESKGPGEVRHYQKISPVLETRQERLKRRRIAESGLEFRPRIFQG
jgi:hypothetical protein